MNPILSINLMGLLRSSDFAERGDIDERDFRHLWTGCYEVRVADAQTWCPSCRAGACGAHARYYRIDPATGAVRKIDGFSVEKGKAVR